MKKYIIKVTYMEGIHEGTSYLLNKEGYVVSNPECVWQDSSYTLSGCKAACTKKEKVQTAEAIFEKRTRARRIAEGKPVSKYPLYEIQKFEPFEIETVDK